MKISHEALSSISDLTNMGQANAPATAPKLQAQSEPQTIPNSATPQDPTILDHVLGTAPSLSNASDNVQNATDSLQDMDDLQSMRLQQLMDNRSQLDQTLSNIMKKQDDTASQILKNMKG